MHATIKVCIIFLAVVLTCSGIQAKNATSVAQTKNLRTLLADKSLVTRQINCVLGKTKCDILGGQLRRAIPEVINRNCARCTSVQATNAKKLINFIQNNYPADYREILNKYRNNKSRPTKIALRVKTTSEPAKIPTPQTNPPNPTTKSQAALPTPKTST